MTRENQTSQTSRLVRKLVIPALIGGVASLWMHPVPPLPSSPIT